MIRSFTPVRHWNPGENGAICRSGLPVQAKRSILFAGQLSFTPGTIFQYYAERQQAMERQADQPLTLVGAVQKFKMYLLGGFVSLLGLLGLVQVASNRRHQAASPISSGPKTQNPPVKLEGYPEGFTIEKPLHLPKAVDEFSIREVTRIWKSLKKIAIAKIGHRDWEKIIMPAYERQDSLKHITDIFDHAKAVQRMMLKDYERHGINVFVLMAKGRV